jgi:hypothetical protein
MHRALLGSDAGTVIKLWETITPFFFFFFFFFEKGGGGGAWLLLC